VAIKANPVGVTKGHAQNHKLPAEERLKCQFLLTLEKGSKPFSDAPTSVKGRVVAPTLHAGKHLLKIKVTTSEFERAAETIA
jgi:hypothetical protein